MSHHGHHSQVPPSSFHGHHSRSSMPSFHGHSGQFAPRTAHTYQVPAYNPYSPYAFRQNSYDDRRDSEARARFIKRIFAGLWFVIMAVIGFIIGVFWGRKANSSSTQEVQNASVTSPQGAEPTSATNTPPQPVCHEQYQPTSPQTNSFFAPPKPSASPRVGAFLLSECSPLLQTYVESLKSKRKLSERINELNLTNEENVLFEKFRDPISLDYMDIPVSLNEKTYDISTLLRLKSCTDPFNNTTFSPEAIQTGRKIVAECEDLIQQTIQARAQLPSMKR